jgi:hypothetical protein
MRFIDMPRLRPLIAVGAGLVLAQPVSASSVVLSAPKSVAVGQIFQVFATVIDPKNVDTVRLNGSFPTALLQGVTLAPGPVLTGLSPATSMGKSTGQFSFGAFSLSDRIEKSGRIAVFTFKAVKEGEATVALQGSSRILSSGEDQGTGFGSVKIQIGPSTPQTEAQPKPLPERVEPGKYAISLFSPSHPDPDAWYRSREAQISWKVAGKSVVATRMSIDQDPSGKATEVMPEVTGFKTFAVDRDGVWYAHLALVFSDRTEGEAHLRVQIDQTPPEHFPVVPEQEEIDEGVSNGIRFAAIDAASGVSLYRIRLDGTEIATTTWGFYGLRALPAGDHGISVDAIDEAGNVRSSSATIRVSSRMTDDRTERAKDVLIGTWWRVVSMLVVLFVSASVAAYLWIGRRVRMVQKATRHRK